MIISHLITSCTGSFPQGDTVTVVVSHLSLEEDCEAMRNPNINKLFVEYRFLGLPPEDTETPFALPKPRPYQSITFNFSKSEYSPTRRLLLSLLVSYGL